MGSGVRAAVPAEDWHALLRASAAAAPAPIRCELPFTVSRIAGTPPEVVQPSLLDDVVCLHLGGSKRVRHERDGRIDEFDVPVNSLTIMPRLRPARWHTTGSIDHLHITLRPRPFETPVAEEVGKARSPVRRDWNGWTGRSFTIRGDRACNHAGRADERPGPGVSVRRERDLMVRRREARRDRRRVAWRRSR